MIIGATLTSFKILIESFLASSNRCSFMELRFFVALTTLSNPSVSLNIEAMENKMKKKKCVSACTVGERSGASRPLQPGYRIKLLRALSIEKDSLKISIRQVSSSVAGS